MKNKYEKLTKLYYKKENIENEYIKRIENKGSCKKLLFYF